MARGITQFHLPPTHERYLPLLPSRKVSAPFGWYSTGIVVKLVQNVAELALYSQKLFEVR